MLEPPFNYNIQTPDEDEDGDATMNSDDDVAQDGSDDGMKLISIQRPKVYTSNHVDAADYVDYDSDYDNMKDAAGSTGEGNAQVDPYSGKDIAPRGLYLYHLSDAVRYQAYFFLRTGKKKSSRLKNFLNP